MTPDKPDTPQAGGADAIARAICSAKCGYRGERACWSLPGAWPNPECDDPGCHVEARVALSRARHFRTRLALSCSEALTMPDPQLTVLQCALCIGDTVLTMPRPARHHVLLNEAFDRFGAERIGPADQGFLLSDGSYAGRKRAFLVAWEAGQVFPRKPEGYNGPDLFSEDLW